MSEPKNLISACSEASELTMRLSALIMARTCTETDLPAVFEISKMMNNFMATVTETGDIKTAFKEFDGFDELGAAKDLGVMAGAWIIVASLLLENLAEATNWVDEDGALHYDEEKYDKETKDLVDGLLKSLRKSVEEDENGRKS